jgi:hypothetical protein
MLFLGPKHRFNVWAEREVLIFNDNLLAKESKQRCSVAYCSRILEGASSSDSYEYVDESDMVNKLRRKMRLQGRRRVFLFEQEDEKEDVL